LRFGGGKYLFHNGLGQNGEVEESRDNNGDHMTKLHFAYLWAAGAGNRSNGAGSSGCTLSSFLPLRRVVWALNCVNSARNCD
jgi:hypothetical protein